MRAPQTATCCRQGCAAAWEVFRNWSQNASRIKLDIISALCLSTVRSKYTEGCKPLRARKTRGDPPRQTGGGTAYRNWPRQFGRATSHAQHLALVGDRQIMGALRDMSHKMALDGVKAGLREHLVLRQPGGMNGPPDHHAILIVQAGPEERLTKFFQSIRIGEIQVQEHPRPF